MRFRFVFVAVAVAVVSAGGSAFATWQLAERQIGAQDTVTMLVAARPKDKPMPVGRP